MLDLILAATVHTTIPFTMIDNRIVVNATVDGKSGYAMVVDTGSSGLTLTPPVAHELNLKGVAAAPVTGAGAGSSAAQSTVVGDVRVGGFDAGRQHALVIDLSRIQRAFHFPRLDGIIGYDMLGANYVGIDVDDRQLTITSTPPAVPSDAQRSAYALYGGLLVVDVAIDGVHGPALLDTGDRSSFTVFEPFARANNFYNLALATRDVVTGIGVGGVIRGDVFSSTVDALGFTSYDVATRAPLGRSGAFDSSALIGSIGNGLLRRYSLIFDAIHKKIYAWRTNGGSEATPSSAANAFTPSLPRHATFGAVLGKGEQGAPIAQIIPNGPAANAGLAPGDRIVALADAATPDAAAFLAEMHRLHARQRVPVQFYRGVSRRSVDVVLGTPPSESDPKLVTNYRAITVDGTLRRTLVTIPNNAAGRLPALLILGGIGCYSVDVASNPQDAYLRLAHDVSAAGFVTMRVEKSGVGDSEGPPCRSVDFEAERRGYAAALAALRADPRVDPSRIYLLGHSIGTLEAPMLASATPVAGVIVAEAVGRDWPEYEVRNTRRQLELSGDSPADVDSALVGKQVCLVRLLLEKQTEAEIEHTEPDCKVHNGVYPVDPPYMQQVVRVNVISEWSKIAVPVLAIYGTSDFVTEQADHERIVNVVNAAHPQSATFVEIDGMDHMLDVAATPKAALEAFSSGAPRMYDADLSATVVRWVSALSKTSPHTHRIARWRASTVPVPGTGT